MHFLIKFIMHMLVYMTDDLIKNKETTKLSTAAAPIFDAYNIVAFYNSN